MATRKLDDPILNDLALMVQGRRFNALTPSAVTRYMTHLDRLDRELAIARGGAPAPNFHNELHSQATAQLSHMTAEIEHLRLTMRDTAEHAARLDVVRGDMLRLEGALFEEFSADIAQATETNAVDLVLTLLRRWKPTAVPEPTGQQGKVSDTSDVTGSAPAASDTGREPAAVQTSASPGKPSPQGKKR